MPDIKKNIGTESEQIDFLNRKSIIQYMGVSVSLIYVTFPDFTRHFLLALSETVDSLLRAILIQ